MLYNSLLYTNYSVQEIICQAMTGICLPVNVVYVHPTQNDCTNPREVYRVGFSPILVFSDTILK